LSDELAVWDIVETEEIADCHIFRVKRDLARRKTDGHEHHFYWLDQPEWMNVIPITPDGDVVFIEQFRHGTQEITLEIPGGLVDPGETPLGCARRELLEETGYEAGSLELLGKTRPNPAIQNNWQYHFLARDCRIVQSQKLDETENIRTRLAVLNDVPRLIAEGQINHSLVLSAFHWYLLMKG
jgi:8-oxo-dGTP pyrophosphatase MutT (NUDIX family)